MAGEWRTMQLGKVAEINPDAIDRDWPHPHIRYIDISSVGEGKIESPPQWMTLSDAPSRAKRLVRKGDTVLSTVRPNRRSMFFASNPGDDWVVSTGFAVIRPNTQLVDARFLYICVYNHGFTEYLITREKGAAYPAVLPEDIANAEIPLPPLSEQRAIAHILGTLDDKIELNRRMNQTLEEMARALFKSWFVDFDPVRAKAAVRRQHPKWSNAQVSRAACPNLKPEIAELFPDSFENSELGEIPKGWKVVRLGELIETIKGCSYRSDELIESDTALVTLKSFARGGGYRPDGLKSFIGTYKSEQIVNVGDIVIACTDVTQKAEVIGRAAIILETGGYKRLVASLDTFIVRPFDSSINRSFLYFLAGTEAFVSHIFAHTTGTTVLHLAKDAIQSFKFVYPSNHLVDKFHDLTNPILDRFQSLNKESRTLAALRDALLPKLISGEIRVKDAEKFLKERGL